jgi:hypothetical protein
VSKVREAINKVALFGRKSLLDGAMVEIETSTLNHDVTNRQLLVILYSAAALYVASPFYLCHSTGRHHKWQIQLAQQLLLLLVSRHCRGVGWTEHHCCMLCSFEAWQY